MAAPCFVAWNGNVTNLTGTTVMTGVATSAVSGTPKTLLQIAPLKTIRVCEWGYIFTTVPTTPLQMELVETAAVFATVTSGANSVANYNDVTGPASQVTVGVGATGFNATAEGTITATRLLAQTEDNAIYFKQQFPLGREPEVNAGASLRVRGTPTSAFAITVLCYVIWEE